MARLVVLTDPDLADGFRLAGSEVVVAREDRLVADDVRAVVATGDVGLLLITADVWDRIDDRLRGQLERLARPVVMAIPAGVASAGSVPGGVLGEMLQRAIGYRIELGIERRR